MKKLFIAGLFALVLTTSSVAAGTNASSASKEHFSATFSNAKMVSWNSNARYEKASFVLDNEKVDAFYDLSGEMIGTSKVMAFDKLPKNAIETITTKYTFPAFTVKDCIEFTNANNEKNYYVSLDKNTQTLVLEITKGGMVSVFSTLNK